MEEPSSSSKVTVEYFDPYGVYQLLEPGLLPRLPLRNLHWESHSGPLRSIDSLHIDLVSSAHESLLPPESNASPAELRGKTSDGYGSGDDGFRTQSFGQTPVDSSSVKPKPVAVKERRHQIPGLRSTPYLKVFLLRCDDNEEYKTQARKQIKDWIKEHTTSRASKASSQENHAAFEWLLIHVIVPNTAAASQPRTSGKTTESSSGSAGEKARWRGGGSTTILEKLKADFNGSSKSTVGHIAQIRIGINDVPYEMLPRVVPAIPGSYTETQSDCEAAWADLVSKLKSLILTSFDSRVSQYEEDVREKDSQRALPGWNFCTFFVLKEGLARGFESVGLVEDALVGYDELAIGLDAVIKEHIASSPGIQQANSFLPYTEELRQRAEQTRAAILKDAGTEDVISMAEETIDLQSVDVVDQEADEIPVNASKKRYRELILQNDVSLFDFRCYIFARQLSLLLRLANAGSSREELLAKLQEQRESSLRGVAARLPAEKPADDAENLAVLAEVCRRTMEFVASIARIMRDDLWASHLHARKLTAGTDPAELTLESNPLMRQIIDNIVSSFTFSVAQQILAQTSTKSLPIPPSSLAPPGFDGHEPKSAIPEPKSMMHPARSSSLALRSASREPPRQSTFSAGRRTSLPDRGAIASSFLKNGLEELATRRAELYLLSRSVLEHIGGHRGWNTGWNEVAGWQRAADEMKDVSLDEDAPKEEEEATTEELLDCAPSLHGVDSKLLRTALDNQDDFYRLHETLTDKALRHYVVANRTHSAQMTMADLAVLKFHLLDYAAAASYFYKITPTFGEGGWAQIELSMLIMHAKCLHELKRRDDYVGVVLKLLTRAADDERERLAQKSAFRFGTSNSLDCRQTLPEGKYLHQLLQIAKEQPRERRIPLESFFSRVEVDSVLQYHPEKDSFALGLRLQYLLQEDMIIEEARVRIIAPDTGREIWLVMQDETRFPQGIAKIKVHSNETVPGTYEVTHIILKTHNIVMDYAHDSSHSSTTKGNTFFKCPKLLLYQREEAFDVKLVSSRRIYMNQDRTLEIELSSGWNSVSQGELRVRPATAGLRLQTSGAKVVSGSLDISKPSAAGAIAFGAMQSTSTVKLELPYTLEQEVSNVALKLEVSYTTEKGNFVFAISPAISVTLPLGINVQDIFKHKALFSRFTVSTSTTNPLRLLSATLEGSEVFDAVCGVAITRPLTIFARQPACLMYKITRKSPQTTVVNGSKQEDRSALRLVVHYVCLEEEVDRAIEQELRQTFQGTPLQPYIRLIVPSVLAEFHARFSSYELQQVALLGEIPTSNLADVIWRGYFLGLGCSIAKDRDASTIISQYLYDWQQRTAVVPLRTPSLDKQTLADSRSVIITLGIPAITVVHTADLRLLSTSPISGDTFIAASNEPISASLHIKWTRGWEATPSIANSQGAEDLEFVYEITGAADTWLVGGRRKGHFRVSGLTKSKSNASFPVVLIPLREGFLPYPLVTIRPSPIVKSVRPGSAGEEVAAPSKSPIVSSETDYKNAGETIRVISDARKTTVSLDASGPAGGAWLLESERRTQERVLM